MILIKESNCNTIPKKSATYKDGKIYQKRIYDVGHNGGYGEKDNGEQLWFYTTVSLMKKFTEDYVVSYGYKDNYYFVNTNEIIGIRADKYFTNMGIITDNDIKDITNFIIDNYKMTYPYSHGDWSLSNIIKTKDGYKLIDWFSIRKFDRSFDHSIMKIEDSLFLAFGNRYLEICKPIIDNFSLEVNEKSI